MHKRTMSAKHLKGDLSSSPMRLRREPNYIFQSIVEPSPEDRPGFLESEQLTL